jgi:hypothetical protein
MNRIGYIGSSDSKIDKAPNKVAIARRIRKRVTIKSTKLDTELHTELSTGVSTVRSSPRAARARRSWIYFS